MKRYPLMLVADDDENDLRMIARALPQGEAASPVTYLHDGGEVLDYLFGRGRFAHPVPETPGLLLLDLHMPRRNGWDVLREVKADARIRSVPIVIFSSSEREHDIRSCYELGATAYVMKPLETEAFCQTVARIHAFWILCNRPAIVASPTVSAHPFSPRLPSARRHASGKTNPATP